MTKYTVVQAKELHILIRMVNECIKIGEHPVGGVTFDGKNYLQSMIFEK
jgi:hypothetical protein